ncbi:histidine phosphatase family protein [Kocuria sp. HSID16901]|uniref:histidine phosphatase family protein n=1 Tax=Kocuria sp. HSID16901 TaxID=2419505 RepID=UPI000660D190|nr:histidine phosphatase family protein [Kocuria sp. HSID16901]MCT1367970.1 histidine phosphatase family protein [Rothia sp. p3-SID1597]RUQ23308.1 histidine phosphatase family protein [Kocuria sp. HSID16901]
MSHSATVHLLRHGEVHNPDRIVYGRLPEFHLSEAGHRMAELAAREFERRASRGARFSYLAASPLTRTQETAAPVSKALGLPVVLDERVIEAGNYFEGMHVNRDELLRHPRHWRYMTNPLRPSWGEPYREQVARMAEAIKDAAVQAVKRGGDGAEAIVVSHQLPIWMARTSVEGRALPHDPRTRQCNLASVTSLTFDDISAPGAPRVTYAEPAAELYPGVIQLPGS